MRRGGGRAVLLLRGIPVGARRRRLSPVRTLSLLPKLLNGIRRRRRGCYEDEGLWIPGITNARSVGGAGAGRGLGDGGLQIPGITDARSVGEQGRGWTTAIAQGFAACCRAVREAVAGRERGQSTNGS
jgi:hypothetical protein